MHQKINRKEMVLIGRLKRAFPRHRHETPHHRATVPAVTENLLDRGRPTPQRIKWDASE
ncbi:MAG: hypothetical protein ACI9OD_004020, partial [Limisphaerales bacterium]